MKLQHGKVMLKNIFVPFLCFSYFILIKQKTLKIPENPQKNKQNKTKTKIKNGQKLLSGTLNHLKKTRSL